MDIILTIITFVILGVCGYICYRFVGDRQNIKEIFDEVKENIDENIEKVIEEVEQLNDEIEQKADELEAKLKKMTKDKIEEFAREFNIELDKRKTKVDMIKDFLIQKFD